MIDEREIVRHAVQRLAPPEPSFERLLRRRDRKRRNQRIAAGVVGIGVFLAAVALVASSPFERTGTPAVPGPTAATGPSVPPDPDMGVSRGLPPEGAEPSSPAHGELVMTFYGRPASTTVFHTGVLQVLVYADGRVIWRSEGGPDGASWNRAGFLEQRLMPEGIEALRSEVISSGLFDRDRDFEVEWGSFSPSVEGLKWGSIWVDRGDRLVSVGWGPFESGVPNQPKQTASADQATALRRLNDLFSDLASELPASAWEDPGVKDYVPSRYAICYRKAGSQHPEDVIEPSEVVNHLPTPAQDLLLGKDRTYKPDPGGAAREVCSEVTTEEARLLEEILVDAGFERGWTGLTTFAPEYSVPAPAPIERAYIRFEPILPHGNWSLFPG